MTHTSFTPKIIIGLGNPGTQYYKTRHSIGYQIVDALADATNAPWQTKKDMLIAQTHINNRPVLLVKPLTYMNDSGKVIPTLLKQGNTLADILVIHDEMELPFGTIKIRQGGSHRGHNGLRSIMQIGGESFFRMRFGIARPAHKEDVPHYVLAPFSPSEQALLNEHIIHAVHLINTLYNQAP